MKQFEHRFWSGVDLSELFNQLKPYKETLSGLSRIFYAGFQEFLRLNKPHQLSHLMEGVQRAMRVAHAQENDKIEQRLSFLATVGSTGPYVGLFGTVWGIMTSFRALSTVQQATISMVAPGISEALIATAIGLFAAIPAVIAYNYFNHQLEALEKRYHMFRKELLALLHRKLTTEKTR